MERRKISKEVLDSVRGYLKESHHASIYVQIKEIFCIFIGLLPYGVVLNQILIPQHIVAGGLAGISEIIYFLTDGGISVWLTTLIFNAMLLCVAIRIFGWKFCARTILGVLSLTFWYKVIPVAEAPILADPFMAVVLGGLVCGCGIGFVFVNNGTSGGADIVAMIVNKYKHISVGRGMFYFDLCVIIMSYFLPDIRLIEPGDPAFAQMGFIDKISYHYIEGIQRILFGLCYTFMCMTAVDWVMNVRKQSVQFFIFSSKYDEIATAINMDVKRGVTILDGEGWYSKQPMKVVTVLARKNESAKIFKLVKLIDPNAFVSQSEVIGVYGQGFEKYE